jgi:hypothetical protein
LHQRGEGVTLLRWSWHVVSILALFAAVASAQPRSQPTPTDRRDFQSGRSDQAPAQPPINVTVTAPERSPEAAKRQEDREERNVAAQEDISALTRALTILAVIQSAITLFALVATFKAATAAKASADAINLTERAQIGVPHDSWKVERRASDDPRYNLVLTYSVRNAGPTLGYFKLTLFHTWDGSGPDHTPTPMEFFENDAALEPWAVILPGESIPHVDHPFLVASQDEIDRLESGALVYWTFGRISYRDLFGHVHYTNFTSRLYLPSKSFSFPLEKGYADGN